MMKRKVLMTVLAAAMSLCSQAQPSEQFSIATLNVDGLPQKLLMIDVNSDGPGSLGSLRIGRYLLQKDYDLVFTQEDFNYHDELTFLLECDYRLDCWSGDVGIVGHHIDFLHLQNLRFECDGLGACWKNNVKVESADRTAWNTFFGKFSHANDEMVTKGFRRYELTLAGGTPVVVYNMHMDASDDADELEGNDAKDREARQGEWKQLLADILDRLDERPVIVVGDLNSYYWRDDVENLFINAIAATGKATASDVWVELEKGGVYPASAADDEVVDKIIYINPTNGVQLKALSFNLDKEGYLYEGQPLGDHYPVSATFEVKDDRKDATAISDVNAGIGEGNGSYYNFKGQRVKRPVNGLYIEQKGKDARKRIVR
ncbi:MAG: hypothetical protein IJP75_06525 [Bacteroidaceae bacterium]|nr:hypothetical protein [Bacteroidaceae bacterium]